MAFEEKIDYNKDLFKIIEFKGSKRGIDINIKGDYDFDIVKQSLIEKIESARFFFKGAKLASINSKTLTLEEINDIKDILQSKFDINFVSTEIKKEDAPKNDTVFVRNTLRSGICIKSDGNLIIIGDVNPGAKVVANGNIIIMGCARGYIHAGASGNRDAFVSAHILRPIQLRIADIISIAPEEDFAGKNDIPEIAMIKDDIIVIEPYLFKK